MAPGLGGQRGLHRNFKALEVCLTTAAAFGRGTPPTYSILARGSCRCKCLPSDRPEPVPGNRTAPEGKGACYTAQAGQDHLRVTCHLSMSLPTSDPMHQHSRVAFLITGHPDSDPLSPPALLPRGPSLSSPGLETEPPPWNFPSQRGAFVLSHPRLPGRQTKCPQDPTQSAPSLTSSPNILAAHPGLVLWCLCWSTRGPHWPQGLCR